MATKEELQAAVQRAKAANDPEAAAMLQSDLDEATRVEAAGGQVKDITNKVVSGVTGAADALTPKGTGGGGIMEFGEDLIRSTKGLRDAMTPAPAGGGGPWEGAKDFYRNLVENVPNAVRSGAGVVKGWGLGAKQGLTKKDYSPEYIDISKRVNKHVAEQTERESKPGGMVGAMIPEAVLSLIPGLGEAGAAKLLTKVPRVVEAFNAAKEIPVAGKVLSGAQTAATLPFKRPFTGATGGAAASSFEPRRSDQSQLAQTLLMAGGGAVGDLMQMVGGRAVTPFRTTDKERSSFVKLLEDKGADSISVGQATGSPLWQSAEVGMRQLPVVGSFMTAGSRGQKVKAANAVAGEMGSKGSEEGITGTVLGEARQRIGAMFDVAKAAPANALDLDLRKSMKAVEDEAKFLAKNSSAGIHPELQKQFDIIKAAPTQSVSPGKSALLQAPQANISGAEYTARRSALTRAAVDTTDSDQRRLLNQARDALDEWADRNLKVNGKSISPELREARKQYAAMEAISPSVEKGEVDFRALERQQINRYGDTGYETGAGGDLSKLAKAGKTVFESQGPDSGTARNLFMAKLLKDPRALMLGGGAAASAGGLATPEGAQSTAAGALTPLALFALSQTKGGRKYMTNSKLNQGAGKQMAKLLKYSGGFGGSQMFKDKEDKLPDWIRKLTDEED